MSHIVVITTLSHPLEVTEKCPYKENQWILSILRTELEMAMALTGCTSIADIDRSVLWQW